MAKSFLNDGASTMRNYPASYLVCFNDIVGLDLGHGDADPRFFKPISGEIQSSSAEGLHNFSVHPYRSMRETASLKLYRTPIVLRSIKADRASVLVGDKQCRLIFLSAPGFVVSF